MKKFVTVQAPPSHSEAEGRRISKSVILRFAQDDGTERLRKFFLGLVLVSFIFSVAEAEEIRYDKGARRDPFQPLIGPDALRAKDFKKEALPLEGVVYDAEKGSYAVVDGEIYQEGESIGGAKLIKIFPDRVVLLQETEEVVIWLREEILEPDPRGEKKGKKDEKKKRKHEKK